MVIFGVLIHCISALSTCFRRRLLTETTQHFKFLKNVSRGSKIFAHKSHSDFGSCQNQNNNVIKIISPQIAPFFLALNLNKCMTLFHAR